MTTWKVVVWSSYRTPGPLVWRRLTDPGVVAASLPRGLRWTVDDPHAVAAAWRGHATGAFTSTVHLGPVSHPWPLRVVDGEPDVRSTTRTVAWPFTELLHRRRLERAIGGRWRYVDEVVASVRTHPSRLSAEGIARTLAHVQAAGAADLSPEGPPSVRLLRLPPAKAAHAEDALAGEPPVAAP